MLNYIIGIMAMIGGFVSYVIDNPVGVYGCFGYAFILWCVMAVFEYRESRKKKVNICNSVGPTDIKVAYKCDAKACRTCQIGEARYCYHTTDIRHAENFVEVEPGKYMEKE